MSAVENNCLVWAVNKHKNKNMKTFMEQSTNHFCHEDMIPMCSRDTCKSESIEEGL
jgi:hypothetical protein